jgi:hypothetical protein
LTEFANSDEGRKRAGHELGRATPRGIVRGLRLEELRLGQHDPELVVQAMIERLQLAVSLGLVGVRADDGRRHAQAWLSGAVPDSRWFSERAGDAPSRQRVSAKIRMDPPAVRTYSTFPAEIQL